MSSYTDTPRNRARDKEILEAAYNANPKPDKAARLAIVNRVSLNEKEVQVGTSLVQASALPRLTRPHPIQF